MYHSHPWQWKSTISQPPLSGHGSYNSKGIGRIENFWACEPWWFVAIFGTVHPVLCFIFPHVYGHKYKSTIPFLVVLSQLCDLTMMYPISQSSQWILSCSECCTLTFLCVSRQVVLSLWTQLAPSSTKFQKSCVIPENNPVDHLDAKAKPPPLFFRFLIPIFMKWILQVSTQWINSYLCGRKCI